MSPRYLFFSFFASFVVVIVFVSPAATLHAQDPFDVAAQLAVARSSEFDATARSSIARSVGGRGASTGVAAGTSATICGLVWRVAVQTPPATSSSVAAIPTGICQRRTSRFCITIGAFDRRGVSASSVRKWLKSWTSPWHIAQSCRCSRCSGVAIPSEHATSC
jgi:hypothetical protein